MEAAALIASIFAAVMSLIAALGVWRPAATTQPASEQRVEELIAALKGGILAELGRVRAGVEAGIRDASDTTRQTQDELHNQTARIASHLHDELQRQFALLCDRVELLIEHRFGQLVNGIDKRFAAATEDQRAALAEQLDHLRDLRRAYESHLVSLRKDVAAHGTQTQRTVVEIGSRIEAELEQFENRLSAILGRPAAPVRVATHH